MRVRSALIAGVFCTLGAPIVVRAGEHAEIGVGRTTANQLVADGPTHQVVPIPRSVFPGFGGYATALLGFANVDLDDPANDAFTLSPGSSISARLIGRDPGAAIFNGLPELQVGQSMDFGPPFFDYHPVFSIPNPAALHGQVYSLRFILHDDAGLYTDSDEFTIAMTSACPADFNLSNTVSVQDLFDFLGAWFAHLGEADFNGAGGVTVQDIFDFLAAWFARCP